MIRVFARKTSMTPRDDLAFYDEPPLFDLPNSPICVSVTFTWDMDRGCKLFQAWQARSSDVRIGGPAFDCLSALKPIRAFAPGRFLKPGITITSRGCPKQCPWCLVPVREGQITLLPIMPGYIIQDNNLLACTRKHIEAVFEMLTQQKKGVQFKGGLDIDYLKPWHVEGFKQMKISELWVACDTEAALTKLDKARDLLSDFEIDKRHCYVLMGFAGDTPDAANRRCEKIYDQEHGFLPRAQFYRPPGAWQHVPVEWRHVQWKWSRPAAYRTLKRE